MTEKTETMEDLKKEMDELIEAKEIAEMKAAIRNLKDEITDANNFEKTGSFSKKLSCQEENDVLQARIRCVQCGVFHFIGGPIASWVYSVKSRNYIPSLVGTGIAVVGLPLALVDLGLTLCVGAPVAAAALHITNATEKRRKLGITLPEEADEILYERARNR